LDKLPAAAGNPARSTALDLLKSVPMTFDDVYAEFQPKIWRYLCHLVGPDEADDLAQEVFLKISQALPKFRGDSTLATWVYRIASHSAVDRIRTRSSRRLAERPLMGENHAKDRPADGEHLVFRKEMRECLDQFVDTLSPTYRSAFVLSEYEELTNPEIAAALGISLDAVKIRLHRARRLLQVKLRGRCNFSRDARNELVCEPKSPPVSLRR
jgi:RNA polymerase sigma-70 factor, ECF subfamily